MSALYLNHFGLRIAPFDLTPNPDFFFVGGQRGELLEAIAFAALDAPGIVLVIGEVGSGKTMLCRMLAQRLQQQGHDLIYLDNPSFGPREILHTIARDWGLAPDANVPLQWQLQQQLLARHQQGRRVVLLIDEAQAMPPASLEEIRLLSNLESATTKLLRIVLFGQPELDAKLGDPALRQVRDRVVHRFDIEPLSLQDAERYLQHRLHCASSRGQAILSARAARRIARAAQGRMRALHHLAERALLAAYATGSPTVEPCHVRAAIQDLRRMHPARRPPQSSARGPRLGAGAWAAGLSLALTSALATLGLAWWTASGPTGPSTVASPATLGASDPSSPPQPASAASAALEAESPAGPTARETAVAASATIVANDESAPVRQPDTWRELLQRGQRILNDDRQRGFTVQLLIENDPDAVLRQLAAHPAIQADAWILPRLYPASQPRPTWAVFMGRADTLAEARALIDRLPPAWRRHGPHIRSLSALRQEPQPNAFVPD